jgi:hypothetical protein
MSTPSQMEKEKQRDEGLVTKEFVSTEQNGTNFSMVDLEKLTPLFFA